MAVKRPDEVLRVDEEGVKCVRARKRGKGKIGIGDYKVQAIMYVRLP